MEESLVLADHPRVSGFELALTVASPKRIAPIDLGCVQTAYTPCGCDGLIALPRKEVIQPQLPLRLPCYDFTPIIDPTFDGCLPEGLAHRLRVLPTFVV